MDIKALTFLTATLFSSFAVAAPFCVVTGAGTNCWYYDAQSCRQAAGTTGACVVNANEMQPDGPSRQRQSIRFSTAVPAIEQFNRNMREGDRQRAEDDDRDTRRTESERQQLDSLRRNTDPRLLALSPVQGLSPQTQSAIMSALFAALDMNIPGTSRGWENLQTGAYGAVFPTEIVQNLFGEPCRNFAVSLTAKSGETRRITGTACRKNGQWNWPNG